MDDGSSNINNEDPIPLIKLNNNKNICVKSCTSTKHLFHQY